MQINKLFSARTLVVFLLTLFAVSFYILNPVWQIRGDGHGYYIYLRSLYFDHNLDFSNEIGRYDHLYGTDYLHQVRTALGRIGNPFAIGLGFFMLPFFLLARAIDLLFIHDQSLLLGFSSIYQIFLGLNSVVYTSMGAVFLFLGLRRLFLHWIAWVSALFVVLCSPLLHYVIYEPLMSHGLSFLVCNLIFWYSIVVLQKGKVKRLDVLLLGIFTGIAVLVRWEHLIFALLPIYVLFRKSLSKTNALLFLFVVLLFCIPQAVVWRYLFGSFLLIPQGDGFVNLVSTHFWSVLFSPYHGLFSWHPFLLFGLGGLLVDWKNRRGLMCVFLLILFFEVYLHGSLRDWWGGSAFGARKLCSTLFVFAYGFCGVLCLVNKTKVLKWIMVLLFVFFAIWNYLLMISTSRGYLSLNKPVSYFDLYSAPIKLLIK